MIALGGYFDDHDGDDWFDDDVPRGKPGPSPREEVMVVPYVPVRCPKCGSTKPRTNGVKGEEGKRYHICKNPRCGCRFISEEINTSTI